MKGSDHGIPSYDPGFRAPAEEAYAQLVERERAFAGHLQRQKPWATWAIIALCVAVFLVQQVSPMFERAGLNYGPAVKAGQYWRLATCMFMHGGVLHIGSNMWVLWVLGPFLERALGRSRYLALYVLTGLVGSLASALLSTTASLGASGAIWGLMGAAFGLGFQPGRLIPPLTAQNLKRRLVQPLLINLALSFGISGIDWRAHLGGGAAGFVLAVSGLLTAGGASVWAGERESGPARALWGVLAGALSLACLGSLAVAGALALIR
jgi:membrane associated rhomboid family serine protease